MTSQRLSVSASPVFPCRVWSGHCIDSGCHPADCPLHSGFVDIEPDAIVERAAELRAAESSRCRHRGDTPLRHEPCKCPVIALLPIYRCDHLAADCSDLRNPAAPAIFCRDCPHHSARKP